MRPAQRPIGVKVYTALLLVSSAVMALLGWAANAYYVPALGLLLQAMLLWRGRGFASFKWIMLINQLSGLALILVLWLGGGLGDIKLDIAGVMLLANLLCGGPLMSVLAVAMLPGLHRGRRLFSWFHPADGLRTTMNATARLAVQFVTALLAAGGTAAHAAAFRGNVTLPDGKPAFGAMVTVFNAEKSARQTVYTAADGSYAIRTPYAGKLDVRARLANYDDRTVTVESTSEAISALDLALKPFASKETASEALSASAHNAKLVWPSEADKAAFVSQCNYCHQLGNSTTRVPQSHEWWIGTIRKMEGMLAMVTRGQKETMAGVLSHGFDGKPVETKHDYGATAEVARAKVEEWLVGDALSFIHDMDVAEDGLFYGTDEGHDKLHVLDPTTGKDRGLPSTGHQPAARRQVLGDATADRCLQRQARPAQHGPDVGRQNLDHQFAVLDAACHSTRRRSSSRSIRCRTTRSTRTRCASTGTISSGSRSLLPISWAASIPRPSR